MDVDRVESMFQKINWWIYVIVVCMVFSFILAINYIVKKFNESRLEQRLRRSRNKSSVNQSVQFQNQAEIRPTAPSDDQVPEEATANKGISLVFNKEDNILEDKRRKEEVTEDTKITGTDISGSSREEYSVTAPVSDRSYPKSTNTIEEAKPAYLGKIYQDLHNETKIKITETSNSQERPKETTQSDKVPVNPVKIDDSREGNDIERNKVEMDKVEHNKVEVDKVGHRKLEMDKVKHKKVEMDKVEHNKAIMGVVEHNKVEMNKVEHNNKVEM